MSEPVDECSSTAAPDSAPETAGNGTRRTSTSSAGRSEAERDRSMVASQNSLPSEGPRRQRPRLLNYGTTRSTQQVPALTRNESAIHSPQAPTSRRPGSRRLHSSAAPHRGQEFSVDDDPEEVDKDLKLARTKTRESAEREQRERAMRRQHSTMRRRATAQPPHSAIVESDEREESAEATGNDAAAGAALLQADGGGDPSSEDTLQGEEEEEEEQEERQEEPTTPEDEDDADLGDAESFTLKDRQEAINETHPFGIRIWKPALYKKDRSVQRTAEGDIHSAPGGNVSRWLGVFNLLWTIIFGWWLALLAGFGGVVNIGLSALFGFQSCYDYGRVLVNLAHYLFYPFGKYLKLEHDEAYLHEDAGEGRSISEYERWQTGDLEEGRLFFGPAEINRSIIGRRRDEVEDLDPPANESDSLLGRQGRHSSEAQAARSKTKKRLFGRGEWNVGRVVFFLSFYVLLTPFLFLVCAICWFLVFSIPMGKVTLLLFHHLRRHPLALSFHTDSHYSRSDSMPRGSSGSSILLCTYRAVGLKYWKYTIDGTNIFLINLLGLVILAIFDYFLLYEHLGIRNWFTSPGLVFVISLASIIPLAYFIGQAVASISAQSSMGVGATINAFFSTIVEVFLYCVALKQGKAQLVEGSIIGSIFAGILFLPGLSMCFGALKRKTQRFNVRSAGVTSTMLLFAVIGAFSPTLFYQIYGSHELNCHQCIGGNPEDRDCRRCFFSQVPAVHDRFFLEAVRPYIIFCAICLFLSYVVGLLFTLRTHAAVIWNNEPDEKKDVKMEEAHKRVEERHQTVPGTGGLAIADSVTVRPGLPHNDTAATIGSVNRENIRDSQMYKRILNQSLKQAGILQGPSKMDSVHEDSEPATPQTPYLVLPRTADGDGTSARSVRIHGLSPEDNRALIQQMAEISATAAAVAARDSTRPPKKAQMLITAPSKHARPPSAHREGGKDNIYRISNLEPGSLGEVHMDASDAQQAAHGPAAEVKADEHASGGHDAPNWSRTKSAVILLTATVAYAVIAEILVDTVDAVLSSVELDEKFLGISLFALVPNTTEFLNAISFAMNGNVALSMEIGSSYALQVMLLQMPAVVLFSVVYGQYIDPDDIIDHTFSFIFPQWDMVTVILAVFLMGWVVGEGKSNYFKGSTLILTYLVVAVGFWFSGYNDLSTMGVDRFDTLALGTRIETFRTIGRGRSGQAY